MAITELSPSPDLQTTPVFSHGHQVQFYKSDEFLVQSAARHLACSLEGGGGALIVATSQHCHAILKELGRMEIPAPAVLQRCLTVDADEVLSSFMVNDRPDAIRFEAIFEELLRGTRSTADSSSSPVSAFGEMVTILWEQGKREAAIQLEQIWNDFIRTHSVSLLCAYPLHHFSREEDRELFSRICAQHSSVVPAESIVPAVEWAEHSRQIAELQQKAESLELEVQARKLAEEKLRVAHAELESIIEQRTAALRQLSLQILKLQDVERRRIARELHDSLGQDFVGLKVNFDLLRRDPQKIESWVLCDQLLEHCITEVRTLSYLLHPPMIEDAGFASAAEWYIKDFARRSSVDVSFKASANLDPLPDPVKLVLFRVLQEGLMNVYRHARASSGRVRARREGNHVTLEIQDDGIGISRRKLTRFNQNGLGMSVGLTGIWERVRDLAGRAELISGPKGTTVRIIIPLPEIAPVASDADLHAA